jgi:thiol-disulfide isomerase/thioredoxin
MGKASRTKQDADRRTRIAAQREAQRRAEQRKRIYLAGGSILVVAIVVVALVLVKLNSGGGSTTTTGASNGPAGTALTAVVNNATSVPAATLDQVGSGSGAVTALPKAISGQPPLTSGGKPVVFYDGAEYCPYCAAERWAMVVALSRFGTFTGLSTVHSSSSDVDPNTPTFTFAKATYTSKYLDFQSVEETTNVPNGSGGYTPLQTPSAAQQALIKKYDYPPYVSSNSEGSIPFVDFGNQAEVVGASYDPGTLAGQSWATIAAGLHDPSTPYAKAIDGTANYITAAICKLTGNQPASACTATVKALESSIK